MSRSPSGSRQATPEREHPEIIGLRALQDDDARLLNDTPDDQRHLVPSKKRAPWWSSIAWQSEVISWTSSLLCFLAIIIVLRHYDGKSLTKLPFGIRLNTIISLLGSIGESLLMVPVASAIGQIKWLRAQNKRPMDDFRVLDEASRGPWGSFLLLLRRRGGLFAFVGAIISISALASGAFVQQLVKYGSEFTNEGGAEVPVARLLNGSDFFEFVGYPQAGESGIDSQMISAAYTGLYSPIPGTFNTTATCTSGNCTWAPYYTLAICNTCVNLTSQIKSDTFDNHFGSKDMPFTTSTTQYTLPNGFRLSGLFQFDPESPLSTPILNLSSTAHPADFDAPVEQGQPLSSIAFSQKGSVLLGVLAIGLSPFGVPTQPEESTDAHYPMALPVAYECLLQFCALNMTASQTNGTLQEQISSTYIDNSQNGTSYELSPCTGPNCAFQVTDQTLQATSSWLASFLAAGNASIEGQLLAVPNYDKPELGPVINAMNASVSGFPGLMDNVAASMTQTLRTLPYQGEGWIGSSHYPVTHIQVHWRWLIFPFALLLMSLTLLIVIATKTQQSGTAPWTNSVLAILFHGLDRQPRDQGSRRRMDLMENSTQGLMVEFQRDHGGGHLVLAEETVER